MSSSSSTTTATMPPPPCDNEMVFVTTIGSYSSQAKNLSNGRSTRSNPIVAGGHSWRIAFYPNGKLAGTAGFISLYLLLDDEVKGNPAAADDDIHVNLSLMIGDVARGATFLSSGMVTVAFSRRRNFICFERFVSHDDFAPRLHQGRPLRHPLRAHRPSGEHSTGRRRAAAAETIGGEDSATVVFHKDVTAVIAPAAGLSADLGRLEGRC
nr:unnamed protein product [Digitaria exilis]